jgi:hypothetical protein
MLTQNGKLTDIGSWYMGGVATNNVPKESSATRTAPSIFTHITGPDFYSALCSCTATMAVAWVFLA